MSDWSGGPERWQPPDSNGYPAGLVRGSSQYSTALSAPLAPHNSATAVASLVAGIASYFICPVIGSIVAVALGHSARKDIRGSAGLIQGDTLTTAGIVLGYIHLAIYGIIVLTIVLFVLIGVVAGTGH